MSNNTKLSDVERAFFVLIAAVALLASWLAATSPIRLEGTETGTDGKIKTTVTQQPRTEITVLLAATGIVLIFVGLNGARLTKLTIGTVTAELAPPEVKAAESFAKQKAAPVQVAVSSPHKESDLPVARDPEREPKGKVLLQGRVMSVFSRDAVPESVLQDAIDNWPSGSKQPADMIEFEFAAKQTALVNAPWLVKFADRPAVLLSYQ